MHSHTIVFPYCLDKFSHDMVMCESDCRSRGREFDLSPVPYFRGDYEIISTVFLLHSAESLKKDCCQLQAKVCALSTG